MKEPVSRSSWRWICWFGIVGALLILLRHSHAREHLREALQWISHSGPLGMIAYVVVFIVASVLLLPSSILTIGAGTAFGPLKGVVLTSIGATLGATSAFLVGRYLARNWVARRIANNVRFQAIDRAVAREGWKIVGLTRLSPAFPYPVLNYAYGLTGISLRDYFFASWIGMLPMSVLLVYLGSLLRDVTTAEDSISRTHSSWEWGMFGVSLLATLAVTIYVTRLARRALGERVPEAPARAVLPAKGGGP